MTTDRDLNRIVRSWLDEGVTALPDHLLDAVIAQVPATPQRRSSWLARRTPTMNKFLAVGLGAAAVVVVLFITSQLLGSPAPGGPNVETSPTPVPSVAAPSAAAEDLAEGPFVYSDGTIGGSAPMTVTIPAPGWFGEPGGALLIKGNEGVAPPAGAGIIAFGGDLYVYGDPCAWESTKPDAPSTTVDELVEALAAQASRDASAPVDITVDGFSGKSITLHVPDDADFTECDQDTFGSWTQGTDPTPTRYHQGPGQIDELWIVDVDGVLTVIDAGYFPGTSAEDQAEIQAIFDSIVFE